LKIVKTKNWRQQAHSHGFNALNESPPQASNHRDKRLQPPEMECRGVRHHQTRHYRSTGERHDLSDLLLTVNWVDFKVFCVPNTPRSAIQRLQLVRPRRQPCFNAKRALKPRCPLRDIVRRRRRARVILPPNFLTGYIPHITASKVIPFTVLLISLV
jgi:ribosomal protein L36